MKEIFKKAMSRFATGVCVITYKNPDTQALDGVTISAFSSVSIDPLKILFCLGSLGVANEKFCRVNSFVVNVLSSEQKNLAYQFAGEDLTAVLPSIMIDVKGLPCIRDSLAAIICKKSNAHREGDHDIIVGEVNGVILGDESLQPLLYFKSTIIEDYQHV